ncbi:MAG: KTSC domain-containing protein [Nitrososphaera sp.]|jgi:hypothetical protein
MFRQQVRSNSIASVGYDPRSKTLEVEFGDGRGVFRYYNVPQNTFYGLMGASSKSLYFDYHIQRRYAFMKYS